MDTNDNKNLIEELIKKIVNNPNDTACYLKLANIYMQNGELDLAVSVYESLLDIEPENYIALTNLGSIYFYKYDYIRAVNYYSRARNLDVEDFSVFYNLGNLNKRCQITSKH